METESLAAALEREHHEIGDGRAAFAGAAGDRVIGALRRHIYSAPELPEGWVCMQKARSAAGDPSRAGR